MKPYENNCGGLENKGNLRKTNIRDPKVTKPKEYQYSIAKKQRIQRKTHIRGSKRYETVMKQIPGNYKSNEAKGKLLSGGKKQRHLRKIKQSVPKNNDGAMLPSLIE